MTKMSQHGAFDADTEKLIRDELLAEFSEGASELDFAACQRPDGTVYGTGGTCRKGTPISYRPGDRQGDVYNKGRAAGMRVESILDENKRLREEKGLKMVKGPEAVQSLVRRLNERMGVTQKPADVRGVKTPEQAAKAVKGAEPKKEKLGAVVNEKFLNVRNARELLNILENRQLNAGQREKIKNALAQRAGEVARVRGMGNETLDRRIRGLEQERYMAGPRYDAARKALERAKLGRDPEQIKRAQSAFDKMRAEDMSRFRKDREARGEQMARRKGEAAAPVKKVQAAAKPAWQRERDVMNKGPADPAGQEKQLKFNLKVAQNKGTQSEIDRAQRELREFRKQQRAVKEAARPGARAAQPAAAEKPSMQINKRFLKKETTQKLQEYLANRKLYAYQKKAIADELKRREQGGKGAEPKARNLGDAKARKAAVDDVNKQIEAIRRRRNEPAYQKPDQKAFLDSLEKGLVRRRMDIEAGVAPAKAGAKEAGTAVLMKRAAQPGSAGREARRELGQKLREKNAKLAAQPEIASAKPRQVNQKFLAQPTDKLQAVLRRGDLGAAQRRKIEEELGGRGVTPAKPVKVTAGMTTDAAVKAGWKLDRAVKDYDPIAVYSQSGNRLLAKGAFGAAYRTDGPPPGVVKQGKIGQHEAEVWQKLQGTGRVPEFHGAVVSPNMKTVGSGYGGHVKEGQGYLGIGEAKGIPVGQYNPRSAAEKNKVLDEYIRTRRDIHKAGVAHNDMHGNNVFYDKETGKMQAIDFGLAQPSYKAALMEAFGTNQGDWQSERFIGRYKATGGEAPAYYRFRRNQERVNRMLEEQDIDTNHMRGMGIRNKPEHIDRVLNGMSEQEAKRYVDALYDGV